jgi:hypothetical protein
VFDPVFLISHDTDSGPVPGSPRGGVAHPRRSATLGSDVFSITAIHHWLERA